MSVSTDRKNSRTAQTWRRYSGYLFALPYLILFIMFLVAPLFYGLGLSLFNWEILSRAPAKFDGLANYGEALHDSYFWKALWATFRFVLLATPLTVGVALLVALGLHNLPAKRQTFSGAVHL